MKLLYDIQVTDRQSFIKFLELLHQDILTNKDDWGNPTIEKFLGAMIAYSEDIQGYIY
jgi:hypothetical protein